MKLTNKHGLPDTFYQAVRNDKYSKGGADYSATDLINPVRITILKQRHFEEIEEDVTDRFWALLGKSVHAILESADIRNGLTEERISVEVGGRKISGQADLYHNGVIQDYKVTSAYTSIYGSRTKEWTQQLNIYADLFTSQGFNVDKLQIVAIYRDWSASKALSDTNYPQRPVDVIDVDLWSDKDRIAFIEKCVFYLVSNEKRADNDLPPCTKDEMWEKETVYAVMKEGRKSAVKLFEDDEGARLFISGDKDRDKLSVVVRPGERTRCEKYCSVNKFCNIYQEYENNRPEKGNILTSE